MQLSELNAKHTATQSELDSHRDQVAAVQGKLTEVETEKNNLTRELSEKVSLMIVLLPSYLLADALQLLGIDLFCNIAILLRLIIADSIEACCVFFFLILHPF